MPDSAAVQLLDLGRLLRLRATIMKAAQVDATYEVGRSLLRVYNRLRSEILESLSGNDLADLRAEFERLFPAYQEPLASDPVTGSPLSPVDLAAISRQAQLELTALEGWIQGLIDELTFEQRMQIEAEAKAAQERRPPTGFVG